jgi:asparagine synthase (glutamine-hydrolysing)
MCGIAGMWLDGPGTSQAAELLVRMTNAIAHRGPDGSGAWWDHAAGVGLGHRRLAIIDLSDEGRQPMISASGRYTLVFNGEVYNYESIRQKLGPGRAYRGHSDTEVMLAAIEDWGLERAVGEFAGMFACALWDRQARRLSLFRDRFGKKPIYYSLRDRRLHFGSELKALRQVDALCRDIDRDALAAYLEFNYVPTPASIYQGVHKLRPGIILHLSRDARGEFVQSEQEYWSARRAFAAARQRSFRGTIEDATVELESLLRVAVRERMVSDVPLGAFLSGGLDSSTVVGLMQAQSQARIRTFSIGFLEDQYNEAVHAAAVARHLGTDHTELYVEAERARAVVPLLSTMFDEPFADCSQIPTYLVSQLARRHVTVALSGDGGDEIFCGYNRYLWWTKIHRLMRGLPLWSRQALAGGVSAMPPVAIDRSVAVFGKLVPRLRSLKTPGDKLHKIAAMLRADSPQQLYLNLMNQWYGARGLVLGGSAGQAADDLFSATHSDAQRVEAMMLHDVENYLPDDILAKVDRASMAVSLEARCPLLDHRVAQFAASLPLEFKLHEGQTKRILRRIAYQLVPQSLLDRPKTGFGVPIDSWLRGPLRDWAESLISRERLQREGYFDPQPIRHCWEQHLSGHRQWQYRIWGVLMFQAWLDEQRRQTGDQVRAA